MGSQQQATIRFVVSTADAEHDLKLFHKRVEAETKRQHESQIKSQASPDNVRYQKDAEFHAEKLYKLKRQERDMVEAEDTRHYMAMKKQEDYDKRVAGGVGGGKMAGALSGFGGKMLLGHAAGIAAGDILGDQHGGRELGAIAGAAMFGGPMVVAAVAGMELIGTAFRTHRENIEATRKSEQDLKNTTLELSNTWSSMATNLVERNTFGKAMEGEYKRATAAAEKFYDVAQQQRHTLTTGFMPGISFGEALMQGLTGEKPGSLTAYRTSLTQTDEERNDAATARRFRNEEYPKQVAAKRELLDLETRLNKETSVMRPGGLKEREQIENKYLIQHEALVEVEREQNALAQKSVDMTTDKHTVAAAALKDNVRLVQEAKARIEHLKGPLDRGVNDNERQAGIEQAKKDIIALEEQQNKLQHIEEVTGKDKKEAEDAQQEKKDQNAFNYKQLEAKRRVELIEEEARAAFRLEAQTEKTAETQAKAKERGYAGEEAALRLHYDYELKLAKAQSSEMVKAVRDQLDAEKQIRERAAHEQIQAQIAGGLSPAGRAASRAIYDREMAETRARHATKEEERATEDKLLGIDRYRREEAEGSIELALKRHAITQRDAEVQKAYLDNPLARGDSPEAKRIKQEISALADLHQKIRGADIYNPGFASTQYIKGYTNFSALNQARRFDQQGAYNPGQASSSYTPSFINPGALNQTRGVANQGDTAIFSRIEALLAKLVENTERGLN